MYMAKTIKIKKLSVPLNKISEKEAGYVVAILEDVNSNFKAFGEVLSAIKERGDATFEEVGRINERLTLIEMEVKAIRNDIDAMKTLLTQKSDVSYLKKIESRLIKVEQYLNLSPAMA